jgi:hypothetical protein
MSLPFTLERLAGQLREATGAQARRGARRRRLQVIAVSIAAAAVLGSAAVASGWLGGKPAPDSVKRVLTIELRTHPGEIRSAVVRQALASIGTPIVKEAIVAASLDAQHFVWGVPTTTGGYCLGVSGPHLAIGSAGCSGAASGTRGSYYDCDGSVIIWGRIGAIARSAARTLELRHDGTTLRIPLDPALHGFFIARLPAAFFRDVAPRNRRLWPRTAVIDARGRVVPPANVNSGRMGPPDHVRCSTP